MSENRVVHLDVTTNVHLDGKSEVGVTITTTPAGDAVVEVRPKGRHIAYTGLLSDLVMVVAARHAKALAAANGSPIPRPRKGLSRL
jgi:hypothetical protein